MDELELGFHQDMVEVYEAAKRDLGYNATRFIQMVSQSGGLAAARQLIRAAQPSEGFTTLWNHHRLDLSVEAHVLLPKYEQLFSDDERELARVRLDQFGWRPLGTG